jgi:hypothetical protein
MFLSAVCADATGSDDETDVQEQAETELREL